MKKECGTKSLGLDMVTILPSNGRWKGSLMQGYLEQRKRVTIEKGGINRE